MNQRRLRIFCTAAFLIWAWLGMSNMDYRIGDATSGMTTAFYFYVGLPILGVVGYLSTIPFELLSRRLNQRAAWIAAACVYIFVVSFAYFDARPRARMTWALGVNTPAEVELRRLVQRDSFNDGFTVWGICTATPLFTDLVVKENHLTPTVNSNDFRVALGDERLPEQALGHGGGLMQIYYHEPDSLLYFSRRGSKPTP